LFFTCLGACSTEIPDGSVQLHLSVDFSREPPIERLVLHKARLLFRAKGLDWEAAWTESASHWAEIDLGELSSGEDLVLLAEQIPGDSYEHIFLTGSSLSATGTDGKEVEISNILEPIAVVFEHQDDQATDLFLELIILEEIESPGSYMLFAKDAGLVNHPSE
jgi:hypothetical protein